MPGQPEPGSNIFITMDCTNVTVSSPGLPSTLIVDSGAPFSVSADFSLAGLIAPGLLTVAGLLPGADFQVQYMYESLGPGPEGTLGVVNISASPGVFSYGGTATTLNVGAGSLPAGTYKLVAVVRTLIPGFGFITGFNEGPIIQVQ